MADYDKSTGTAGTIRIRDLGYQIQFWLYCSDGQTRNSALPWTINVNGQTYNGTINWTAGRGEAMVAAYDVGSNQTVSFGIGSTGTQGFGGPTSLSVDIKRASAPNAPKNLRVREGSLRHLSFGVDYDSGGDNGAGINQFRVHWRRQEDYALMWEDMNSFGYSNPDGSGVYLNPGMVFLVAAQAHNSEGWGPWSAELPVRTLPGVWVPDPNTGQMRVAIPYAWVDNGWRACVPFVVLPDGTLRETIH